MMVSKSSKLELKKRSKNSLKRSRPPTTCPLAAGAVAADPLSLSLSHSPSLRPLSPAKSLPQNR